MKLYSICYVSQKSDDCTNEVVQKIIKTSSLNNSKKEISGILIEYNNSFIQYLEGEPITIHELFELIKNDSRHQNVQLLKFTDIDKRLFNTWNMVYKNLNDNTLSNKNIPIGFSKNLDEIIEKKEFWNGIETIEFLLNLNKD